MDAQMQQCIQECTDCHNTCVQTVAHCLQMGGKHAEAGHITALLDCADTCRASADFMLRGSAMHSKVCGVCAEACERCATSCEQIGGGDAQMQACAEECRRCAESCKRMASMM
ncbi:MAG: four-helix bundle copper-binding protein [Chloroflexota bacterium]|nr:four-helix bundle copper-binding protein [Chloroflexota bacterium]